eukprot:2091867-Rhodomonas_salina.1
MEKRRLADDLLGRGGGPGLGREGGSSIERNTARRMTHSTSAHECRSAFDRKRVRTLQIRIEGVSLVEGS